MIPYLIVGIVNADDRESDNPNDLKQSIEKTALRVAEEAAQRAYIFNTSRGFVQEKPKKASVGKIRKSLRFGGKNLTVRGQNSYISRVNMETQKVTDISIQPGQSACQGSSEIKKMDEVPEPEWTKEKTISLGAEFIKEFYGWKNGEFAEPATEFLAARVSGGRQAPHWAITWKRRSPDGFYYLFNSVSCWISEKYGVFRSTADNSLSWEGLEEGKKIVARATAFKQAVKEGNISLRTAPILKGLRKGEVDSKNYTADLYIVRPNDFRRYSDPHDFALDSTKRSFKGRLAWVFTFNWIHPDPEKRKLNEYDIWVYLDAVTLEYIGGEAIL